MKELTERQARAALAAVKEFQSMRRMEPRRYAGSSVVYGMSAHTELIALDIWVMRVQLPGATFRAGADNPQAAIEAAIAILSHRLGADQPKKRGPHPGPRVPKDGRTPWTDTELACMRVGIEAMIPQWDVAEAMQEIGDDAVVITCIPGSPWCAKAKVRGSRTKVLVAKGETRAESLRRLALRN
jgi:hypothetical protein